MKMTVLALLPILSILVACQSVHPYFDDTTDATTRLADRSAILAERMMSDLEACERSVFSTTACDRAIDSMDDWREVIDETRIEMRAFDPPSEADAWHLDYLSFLSDSSAWLNGVVTSYYAGDFDTFMSELDRIDGFIAREDRLGEEYESIQKEMGAR